MPRPAAGILTLLLWGLTTALGIAEVVIAADLLLAAYAAVLGLLGVVMEPFGREYWTGINIQTIAALILALIVLATAVFSGEIYLRQFGTRRAWKLGATILGIEIAVLALGYFVSPDAFYLIGLLSGAG